MDIFPNRHLKRQFGHGEKNKQRQAQQNIVFNHLNNKHLRQLNIPVTPVPTPVHIPVPTVPVPVPVSIPVSVSIPEPVVSSVGVGVENTDTTAFSLQYIKDKMKSEYKNLYK